MYVFAYGRYHGYCYVPFLHWFARFQKHLYFRLWVQPRIPLCDRHIGIIYRGPKILTPGGHCAILSGFWGRKAMENLHEQFWCLDKWYDFRHQSQFLEIFCNCLSLILLSWGTKQARHQVVVSLVNTLPEKIVSQLAQPNGKLFNFWGMMKFV